MKRYFGKYGRGMISREEVLIKAWFGWY